MQQLFIDTGTVHDAPFGHPFEGYYIPYPDSRYAGLVTTITHEAPIMNWVFMDPLTYSFQFGVRVVADANLTGPWDCTRQDRRLTFCGWEGFCAVLEDSGVWGLYYDFDGDGMRKRFGQEARVVIEIALIRSELRMTKPEPEPQPQPQPQPEEEASKLPRKQDEMTQPEADKQVEESEVMVNAEETKDTMTQEVKVSIKEKIEKMSLGNTENSQDQETCSVISDPLSALSMLSTDSGGMPPKRRKRRSRAHKYQSPSVANSEEYK